METFRGYRRPDGTVGVRNQVAVIPSVVCANTVVQRIAQLVPGTVALPHPHGCAQIGDDVRLTDWTLAGAAASPNVGAALIVGLGCETCQSTDVLDLAHQRAPGKRLEQFSIQEVGGSIKAIQRGVAVAKALVCHIDSYEPELVPISELILATECGSYDATSSMAANPAVGVVADMVVAAGGTVLLGETPELMGAEHVLARRARTKKVARRLFEIVANIEAEVRYRGATLAGNNPTPGRAAEGLTTLEEKALGCIRKGGTTTVQEVIGYADCPTRKGLIVMDTPSHDTVALTGMVAGGAQLCISTTGRGSTVGNALAPVITITANPKTAQRMADDLDLSAAGIIEGTTSREAVGEELFKLTLRVASGAHTAAEIIGHQEFDLYRIGPQV